MIAGLVIVITIFLAIVFCLFSSSIDREAFNMEFPAITDDEFVAACAPGTDRAIALRVREIVAEQLGVEYERLHPAMRFVEDLGADWNLARCALRIPCKLKQSAQIPPRRFDYFH